MTKRNTTRPDAVRASVRRWEVLRLRLEGLSFRKIADRVGVDTAQAWHDLQTVLSELKEAAREDAEAVLAVELMRLDELTERCWPLVESGDMKAVDRLLRIMERRAKLLGLDAPTKIAPTDPSGETEYAGLTDERLRELAAKVLAVKDT